MTVVVTENIEKEVERLQFFKKLKNKFFSLYETESEISQFNTNKKISITVDEYDYIETLRDRQKTLKSQIQTLVDEHKD